MASEAIELVDDLVKEKISKETATKLVDFIEKNQSEKISLPVPARVKLNIILWALGLAFTFLFSLIVYLHSEMNGRADKIENRIDRLENKIDQNTKATSQINQKLDRLLSK